MKNYKPCLDWLRDQHDDMKTLLIEWSHINSGSMHTAGLDRMLSALQQTFSRLEPTTMESYSVFPLQRVNSQGVLQDFALGDVLHLRKRPDASLQILLCGHMDTVFGFDHTFQKTKKIDDNTLNGPGVSDMKGGLLVMLYALLALERSPFANQLGWEVFINADEEIGSYGSAPFLEKLGQYHTIGLVFEPATDPEGTLVNERKGTGNFVVVARGRASHAGRAPELGRNAIRALADFIVAADELNKKREGIVVNVGRIEGGGATNIVPDLALCYIDVRTRQIDDETWLQTSFNEIINNINQRDGIHLELHGEFTRQPKPFTQQTAFLLEKIKEIGNELNLTIQWQPSGGCCDGNNLSAQGVTVVDTLGVRGGKIHSSDEFILLDSLVERAQLTALLLMKIASGEIVLEK